MNNTKNAANKTKVVEVLSASDLNPKYLNCVRFYITSWLSMPTQPEIRFIPKVLLIADSIPEDLVDFSEYLSLVDSGGMHSAFVSQTARVIEGRNSSADFVMTSDIDMLPMSINFESDIVHLDDETSETFYILRDVLEPGQYPICYNLAKPSTWALLLKDFDSNVSTSTILRRILQDFGGTSTYSGVHGGEGWTIDQQALWNLTIKKDSALRIQKFSDRDTKHRRLDRAHHIGVIKWLVLPMVFTGYYHDYHVHHPVNSYKKYLRILIKIRNLGAIMRIN